MKALLIVDVQNDFLPGGALAVPGSEKIIDPINALLDRFDLIIATKDWHPPKHISFASRHGKQPGERVPVLNYEQELWPDHCVQDTQGAELSSRLKQEKIVRIFYKGTDPEIDSYSAFYDNARLRDTGLREYLEQKGISEISVVGLATDFCVKFSVLDACKMGLKVTVIEAGCRAIGDPKGALEEMREAGAHIIP